MYQVLYNVLLLGSTFLNMDVEIFLVIHYHMEKIPYRFITACVCNFSHSPFLFVALFSHLSCRFPP